jgi:peptidoglycan/LPS O-acetylase OafA/YrhL
LWNISGLHGSNALCLYVFRSDRAEEKLAMAGDATDAVTATVRAAVVNTKQHFDALDGLRGIAALSVVTFHFLEMAIPDYSKFHISHGFLAVDFFFCLSGFVIGYAYDERIGTMGVWEFLKSRLIRLHPLVVLGSVLGLVTFLFDPFGATASAYSAGKIALIFLASIFLIPYPAIAERGHNLFSLNAPAWSLFWEYVANVFYAVVLLRLGRRLLLPLTLMAGVGLCLMGYHEGSLLGGWSGGTFWDGGVRVAYSFLAGLMVYRARWVIRTRLGFTALSLLLLAAFVMPFHEHAWVREALVVLFYFPLLVALGAGATLSNRSRAICVFSGNMSYPLYMTHYAVIWSFGNYCDAHHPDDRQLALIVSISVVRRYLTLKRRAALSPALIDQ